MASVCEHIIGNCLCVLGDAMAMPIGSMIAKFRDEFEAHIEVSRTRANMTVTPVASDEALLEQGAL
jgi:NADH-quinone oxidoreductase subunit F